MTLGAHQYNGLSRPWNGAAAVKNVAEPTCPHSANIRLEFHP